MLQDEFAVARLMAVELKAGLVCDQWRKQRLALDERQARDVPAIEMRKIEGIIVARLPEVWASASHM